MSVDGRHKGSDRNRVNADQFAAKLLPTIRELRPTA